MIRKPKIHPVYNINLVGINFRERWNIVEYATKEEIESYIRNFKHIKLARQKNWGSTWWELKEKTVNEATQNVYLRKLWRKRHSESFQQDILYRVDKNIARWSTKLGPIGGDGIGTAYHFDRQRNHRLSKNDILMLTRVDEMGNLYFMKASEVDAKHPYVFNRDNAQLSFIIPVDT